MSETSQGQQPTGTEGAQAATPATPTNPAQEQSSAGAVVPSSGSGAETSPATPADPAPHKEPEWVASRIAELTALRREAERQLAEERARNIELTSRITQPSAEGQTSGQLPASGQFSVPGFVPVSEVQRQAAELANQQRFNEQCDAVWHKGNAAFPDFGAKIQEFQKLGGIPPEFVQEVLASDAPEAVLYDLAGNLTEAHRLFNLPPTQRMAEVIKRGIKLSASASAQSQPKAPALSQAPDPITPKVGGNGSAGGSRIDDENLSMAEWVKLRTAGLKASGKRL